MHQISFREGSVSKRGFTILLVLALIIIAVMLANANLYFNKLDQQQQNSGCASIIQNTTFFYPGYDHVCGVGEASDGRLKITYHNYHFAQAKDIQFQFSPNQQSPLPDEVFLLVNVTVANIGGGNTSLGAGFEMVVMNGTSYVDTTQFIANVTFPNTFPNQTIPNYLGSVENIIYLPPNSTVNLWLIFYVSFPKLQSTNINQTSNFKPILLIYRELGYGGTFVSLAGGFDCRKVPCQNTTTEFIIKL
ncbi:MAG: hypothetical protein QW292_03810 [Candidatus Parvarchaeota archaeon]